MFALAFTHGAGVVYAHVVLKFCSYFILDNDWATLQIVPYENLLNVMVLKERYCMGSDKCKTVPLGTTAVGIKSV